MLPPALALANGPSELRTGEVTAHLLTNPVVIRLFLPVEIGVDGALGGPVTVQVRPGATDPSGLTREAEEPCSAGI
jgi:RNA 3'-terminal phosphate cyclase